MGYIKYMDRVYYIWLCFVFEISPTTYVDFGFSTGVPLSSDQ
jgi:hypothetical protein